METNGLDACDHSHENENLYGGNTIDARITNLMTSRKLEERTVAYGSLSNRSVSVLSMQLSKNDGILKETTVRGQIAVLKLVKRVAASLTTPSGTLDKTITNICKVYACSAHGESRALVLEILVALGNRADVMLDGLVVTLVAELESKSSVLRGLVSRQLAGIFAIIAKCFSDEANYDKAIVATASLLSSGGTVLSNLELKRACYGFLRAALPHSKVQSVKLLKLSPPQEKELNEVFHDCSESDSMFETPPRTARQTHRVSIPSMGQHLVWTAMLSSDIWKERRSGFLKLNETLQSNEDFQLTPEILSQISRSVVSEQIIIPVYIEACKSVEYVILKKMTDVFFLREIFSALVLKLRHHKMASLIRVTRELIAHVGKSVVLDVRLVHNELAQLALASQANLWWLLSQVCVATQAVRVAVFETLVVPSLQHSPPEELVVATVKQLLADAALESKDHLEFLVGLIAAAKISERKKNFIASQLETKLVVDAPKPFVMKPRRLDKIEKWNSQIPLPEMTRKLEAQFATLFLNPKDSFEIMNPKNIPQMAVLLVSMGPEARDVAMKWFVWAILQGQAVGMSGSLQVFIKQGLTEREVTILVPPLLASSHTKLSLILRPLLTQHPSTVLALICVAMQETRKKSTCIEILNLLYSYFSTPAICLQASALPAKTKRDVARAVIHVLASQLAAQSSAVHAAAIALFELMILSIDMHTLMTTLVKHDARSACREELLALLAQAAELEHRLSPCKPTAHLPFESIQNVE